MKKQIPVELVHQLSALVIATILVHLVYMTVIRPNADAVLEQRAAQSAAGQTVDNQRSIYVVLRVMSKSLALFCSSGRSP